MEGRRTRTQSARLQQQNSSTPRGSPVEQRMAFFFSFLYFWPLYEFFDKYYDHVFVQKKSAHLTEGIRDCHITPIKIDMEYNRRNT